MKLIMLNAPVMRDENGWWSHPDMPDFDEDVEKWRSWLLDQHIETDCDLLEYEEITHPAYVAYYENEACHVKEWDCRTPQRAADGWHTLSIHDSEEGPVWVWGRRIGHNWKRSEV